MSPKVPALTGRQGIHRVKKLGFVFFRQAKGSHEIFRHPDGRWTMAPLLQELYSRNQRPGS